MGKKRKPRQRLPPSMERLRKKNLPPIQEDEGELPAGSFGFEKTYWYGDENPAQHEASIMFLIQEKGAPARPEYDLPGVKFDFKVKFLSKDLAGVKMLVVPIQIAVSDQSLMHLRDKPVFKQMQDWAVVRVIHGAHGLSDEERAPVGRGGMLNGLSSWVN